MILASITHSRRELHRVKFPVFVLGVAKSGDPIFQTRANDASMYSEAVEAMFSSFVVTHLVVTSVTGESPLTPEAG